MKRVFMIMVCLLSMVLASTGLKAQEISILLRPGWNWIGYPYPETVDMGTAFGDFEPLAGDVIESCFGYSEYLSEYGWYGGVNELRPGWGYMYYSNRTESVTIVFSHPSTPVGPVTVTTSEPMLITAISAMGGGEVTVSDGTYILAKGLCWATHENPTTNEDSFVDAGSGVGSFSASMDGLNIASTYYVRAYAVTADGTTYGDQKTFTTRDGIPEVGTVEVTNILGDGATCGGTVTDNGGLNVITRGVCWSMSHNPTVSDSHTTNGSGLGSFTSNMTGMSVSTTYYVRAYATTSAGTAYGEEVSFTTQDGIPEVITSSITRISVNHAICSGSVIDNGGLNVIARGVCWSTNHNPTLNDGHIANGTGIGNFICTMYGLSANTTYYVRAYAINSHIVVYGDELCFCTLQNNIGGHTLVDLGLPSGLLWATCNIGATYPEDYGDYYAWAETQPKTLYDWNTYQYSNGSSNTLTKYCTYSSYGYNGFTDNLSTLLLEDDIASVYWGNDWHVPSTTEWNELFYYTTSIWTTQNGVNGRLFTASNGNSIFLPAAGARSGSSCYEVGDYGHYWSSMLYGDYPDSAWYCYFSSGSNNTYNAYSRMCGLSVRPVCPSLQNNVPVGVIDGLFSVSDSQKVYFSKGNLQYIGSANTPHWKFADNQWDYIGDNGQGSSNQNVDRDLFGWGTSGYNHGAICYQPWSTSENYSDYYAYGNYQCNLFDQTGQADWGYNPIINGGYTANRWRTLTREEWAYVFYNRTTVSGIRYAKANVNGVNGVILLPDNWETSTYSLNNTNYNSISFSSNIISASQWPILENAGAVFLPAAGNRIGTSIDDVGYSGEYWSATYSIFKSEVWCIEFFEENLFADNLTEYRCNGNSVRLVHDAE